MAIVRKKWHKINEDKRIKIKYCKNANSKDSINNKKTQKIKRIKEAILMVKKIRIAKKIK